MATAQKAVIYQLVVRYFGNTNQTNQHDGTLAVNGCGRFADVSSAALDSLRQMGVTHVWLTGCLRQASLTDYTAIGLPPDDPDVVKGIAGSFYAVRDYFDVCADYATNPANRLTEFDALVTRIHAAQMKVLIDFVPNHVARGYRSTVQPQWSFGLHDDVTQAFHRDNSFYYLPGRALTLPRPGHWNPAGFQFDQRYGPEDGSPTRPAKETGNTASANPDEFSWYETVKLNYGGQVAAGSPHPRTWDTVNQILAYWQARGVDGFRCDMAHLVSVDVWKYLISEARSRAANVLFVAEAYDGLRELMAAGFDAVYHDESLDRLKHIYQQHGSHDQYDHAMTFAPVDMQRHGVQYLENHDERRVAAAVVPSDQPEPSGFGSPAAGYQLAPLQYLYGSGPVLLLNGQEVGEPGTGAEGYHGEDGRTTIFDYWGMPEFQKWVNGHAYDGGRLSNAQRELRQFYADLLALCQDPAVRSDGYWGLKYFNRPDRFPDCPADLYTFARFIPGGARALVVVANFRPSATTVGQVRLPTDLLAQAALPAAITVTRCLDRGGRSNAVVAQLSNLALSSNGFSVAVPNQSAHVFLLT